MLEGHSPITHAAIDDGMLAEACSDMPFDEALGSAIADLAGRFDSQTVKVIWTKRALEQFRAHRDCLEPLENADLPSASSLSLRSIDSSK